MNFLSHNLPLSFDNALSLESVVHKIIKEINDIEEKYNNIKENFESYTDDEIDKLKSELNKKLYDLKKSVIETSEDYTNIIKLELINKINSINTALTDLIFTKNNETNENITKLIEKTKKELIDRMEQGKVLVPSMYDGTLKTPFDALSDFNIYISKKFQITDELIQSISEKGCTDVIFRCFCNNIKMTLFNTEYLKVLFLLLPKFKSDYNYNYEEDKLNSFKILNSEMSKYIWSYEITLSMSCSVSKQSTNDTGKLELLTGDSMIIDMYYPKIRNFQRFEKMNLGLFFQYYLSVYGESSLGKNTID